MLIAVGLSAISMNEVNMDDEWDSQTNLKDVAQQLLRLCDRCLSFCEQADHLIFIGVTPTLIDCILHTQIYGGAGKT